MKLLLTTILFFGFLSDNYPTKKDILLTITKKYLPDNFAVLKNYDEATINMLAEGDSLQNYIFYYPTVVHEGFHVFGHTINSYSDTLRHYRIDDTTTIAIKKFSSFPSKLLNGFVPLSLQKQIFRYDTYINSLDSNNGTQQNGFLGLLEEYTAYYQSLKAYTTTYYFLKDTFGWTKPQIWIDYLNIEGSEIYSINEFKLFFSWYLQYSKKIRPDIYNKITTDKNIKSLYTKIEIGSQQLITDFLKHRIEILTKIKPETEMNDGFIKLKGTDNGFGIDEHIKKLELTDKLLKDPKNKILDQLRE